MPQSVSRVLLHLVFSTKHRADLISSELDPRLHAYLGGICRNLKSPLIAANGTENHVHLLVDLGRTITIADLLLNIKRDSSKWMKARGVGQFAWQDGYGAFSVSESSLAAAMKYVANQKKHHARMTFEDELRALCRKYNVKLDERHTWD
ncbi:MAG: IS200/IS605 family transposase [Phycisphaeraceae bacterium]|nr:IS200/IS605 family transposase [Phycisphaeraceae bacterium]